MSDEIKYIRTGIYTNTGRTILCSAVRRFVDDFRSREYNPSWGFPTWLGFGLDCDGEVLVEFQTDRIRALEKDAMRELLGVDADDWPKFEGFFRRRLASIIDETARSGEWRHSPGAVHMTAVARRVALERDASIPEVALVEAVGHPLDPVKTEINAEFKRAAGEIRRACAAAIDMEHAVVKVRLRDLEQSFAARLAEASIIGGSLPIRERELDRINAEFHDSYTKACDEFQAFSKRRKLERDEAVMNLARSLGVAPEFVRPATEDRIIKA